MSFSLDIKKFAQKSGKSIEQINRMFCIKIFSDVIEASPVDEGRFRGNWVLSENVAVRRATNDTDKSGAIALQHISNTITGKEKIMFFTNSLPYAIALEFGHSKIQAPSGVIRPIARRYKKILSESIRKAKQ